MSRAASETAPDAPTRLLYRLADTLSLIDDTCLANYRVLHASTPFDDPRYEVYASIIADLERIGASIVAARTPSEHERAEPGEDTKRLDFFTDSHTASLFQTTDGIWHIEALGPFGVAIHFKGDTPRAAIDNARKRLGEAPTHSGDAPGSERVSAPLRMRPACVSCGVQMFSADRGDGSFVCKNDNCERSGDVVFPASERAQ